MAVDSNEGGFGLQEVKDMVVTCPEKTSWKDLLLPPLFPPSPPWDSSMCSWVWLKGTDPAAFQ